MCHKIVNDSNLSNLLKLIFQANTSLSSHREYVENKLASLKKYICTLDNVMTWVMETRTRIYISRELSQQERVEIISNVMVSVKVCI